jgi:hypothetical protein
MSMIANLLRVFLALSVLAAATSQLAAQGGPPWAGRRGGPGRGAGWANQRGGFGRGPAWARQGGGADPQFVADRDLFHFLLQNHDQIRREVKNTPNGVETLTESDKPEIAAKIQEHVAAMAKRVEERRPIHMRDPLFAEVFQHADKIHLKYDKTAKGVRVVETSEDPYVVKLIQAHGGVVSLFVKNGFDEARRNHEVPSAQGSAAAAGDIPIPGNVGCPLAGCPLAAASLCPAGKDCPNAKPCPAGKDCPMAQQCSAAKACPGCPAANACPLGGAKQANPIPKASEKPDSN